MDETWWGPQWPCMAPEPRCCTTIMDKDKSMNCAWDVGLHANLVLVAAGVETWLPSRQKLQIKDTTKLFAPGNLRATTENLGYKEVVDYWLNAGYTLRYTGAMVPDIYQLFIKGEGIFSNMISAKHPARLRYLYEIAPLAFLVEAAGGRSTDGKQSILETVTIGYEMKGPIAVGSKVEVERIEAALRKYP
jgi:sedoheptulose-bisphosphatase